MMDDYDSDLYDIATARTSRQQSSIQQAQVALNAALHKINQRFAVVIHGSSVGILSEQMTSQGRIDIRIMSKDAFFNLFANKNVPDPDNEKKTINLGKAWFNWSRRREATGGLEFDPSINGDIALPNGETAHNLWSGFSYEPSTSGDCSLFLHHVKDNICGGDFDAYDWLMCWCASIIQRPAHRRDAAVVLRSEGEGTGKGFFANTIGELVKRHFISLSNSDHLVGRFNSHLANKILIFADEAFSTADKKSRGMLYNLVTEKSIAVEFKGKDVAPMNFYGRFIIASNHDWVVPAGMDSRRWAVFDVAPTKKQDKGYFSAIKDQLENGGYAALMHTLAHWEITEEFYKTVPSTQGLLEQKLSSMSSTEKWWLSALRNGGFSNLDKFGTVNDAAWWPIEATATSMYSDYLEWCKARNVRDVDFDGAWGRYWAKCCPERSRNRSSRNGTSYHLPDLERARELFCLRVGHPINWGD